MKLVPPESRSLEHFQESFARALVGPAPAQDCATDVARLISQPGFAVYRNTVFKGCIDALQANYPTVTRLVGEEWIRAAAARFAHSYLPAHPMLLEYGAQFLGAPLIMVLGHSGCGAVDAAIKVLKSKAVLPGHLPELIRAIKPAVTVAEKTKTGNLLDNAVAENVRRQMARLKSSPPIVQKLYASKKIDIVGGVYDLATGKIALL